MPAGQRSYTGKALSKEKLPDTGGRVLVRSRTISDDLSDLYVD
jgi:hypothetical protein